MWIIEGLIHLSVGKTKPDTTIILDIPPTDMAGRLKKRGIVNHFDKEQTDFFERCRTTYHQLAHATPERTYLIDAMLTQDAIADKIDAIVEARTTQWKQTV